MKIECAKIRNIVCSASIVILLCICDGCAATRDPVVDTQQSTEMQSKSQSVLSSESDSLENPKLNPEPDEEQETGQEGLPEERQDSPPALELVALDVDAQLTQELLSGNYSWNYEIGDGMMTGGEACGPSPLDEVFYKNQTRNILRYTEQQKQMGIKYEAVFSVMPDSLVVEEWSIDCLGTQVEAERTTYDEPPFMFEFDQDRIYQVTAFWNETGRQERGFYGNASYAFLVAEDWYNAYHKYINEFEYADSCTYTLIYVDEDYIPELVIDTGFSAGGCKILTVHDGVVDELQTLRRNFSYIEGGNLLCNSDGKMGFYYDYVYTIRDDKWEYVAGGEYGDDPAGAQFDEEGEWAFVYQWNGEEVEEDEYDRRLNDVFPNEQAINPDECAMNPKEDERYYIASEICSILSTGDVTSAGHGYELIEADMTWEEALLACELRGGYLTAITSWEELEQIKEQIVVEGKTDISFWVGAHYDGELGGNGLTLGFHWIEPEVEPASAYSMLDLFNALWGFWIGNEPSYDGLAEDGREVDEDYVMLIYRQQDDRCYIRDMPGDILSAYPSYTGKIGCICEYDSK